MMTESAVGIERCRGRTLAGLRGLWLAVCFCHIPQVRGLPVHVLDASGNEIAKDALKETLENQIATTNHARKLLQTTQESFLFTACDCEGWICNTGFYQEFSFDQNCWGCAPCPENCGDGFYRGGTCNPFSSPCKPCTVCSGLQIEAEPCTETSDSVCYECSQCRLPDNTTTWESICSPPSEIETTPPVTTPPPGAPTGCCRVVVPDTTSPPAPMNNSGGNMTSLNSTNITSTPKEVDLQTELFCRFCPRLPPLASYTGQFDSVSGQCGYECKPPLFLTRAGECSCGDGFLNETAQQCQDCQECPQGYLQQCNHTHDAVCFPCVNSLTPLCSFNGTFNASTGICHTTCKKFECIECQPGTFRAEGENCTVPCQNCSTILPANTRFYEGCEYECEDSFYFALGACNPCTECTLGQYLNSPCTATEDTDCRNCPNQDLPPLAEYSGTYDRGQLKCSIVCAGQVPLSADGAECRCPAGKYANSTNQCAPCTECEAGEYQALACGLQSNARCRPCSVCAAASYINTTCTATTNTQCVACSVCQQGSFPIAACNGTEDTACLACSTCQAGQYQTKPCQRLVIRGDAECANCTTCGLGEYARRPCNATADVVCATCTNAKPEGAAWTGEYADGECAWECEGRFARERVGNGSWTCTACRPGFYRQGADCTVCSECTALGEFEAAPCNATSDARCSSCRGLPAQAEFERGVDACHWVCNAGWFRENDNCSACSGAPRHASYTGEYTDEVGDCAWTCDRGFVAAAGGECLCASGWYDAANDTCRECGSCDPDTQIELQGCNATQRGSCAVCPNERPAQAVYTGVWDRAVQECEWECGAGWTADAPPDVNVSAVGRLCYECKGCELGSFLSRQCDSQRQTRCQTCPNLLPADGDWTGEYSPATACGWSCRPFARYVLQNRACECIDGFRMTQNRSCVECYACPLGQREVQKCSDLNDTVCGGCTNEAVNNSMFDGGFNATTGECTWACNAGWTYFKTNTTVYPTMTLVPTTSVEVTSSTPSTTTPAPSTMATANGTNGTNGTIVEVPTSPPPIADSTTPPAAQEPVGVVIFEEGCQPCTECQPGTFVDRPCAPRADTRCLRCPNGKPPGSYFVLSLDARGFCEYECPAGTNCTCPDGQWWDDSGLGLCRDCTPCSPGVFQIAPCTTSANTLCDDCPNIPPEHEVYTGGHDVATGLCFTDCAPGWQRYEPPLLTPSPGNATGGNATAGVNGSAAMPNATSAVMATPEPTGEMNQTKQPCICLQSKIETPEGECNECSECQPGTLLRKPCNATGNEDTKCRPCPNSKPVGSLWEPGVNGTFVNSVGDCVWKCKPGLTPIQEGDSTLCLCLGKPASCGYCPVLPGNATVIGSWCAAFQYLFDGSCQPKDFAGLNLNLVFTFGDWTVDGLISKLDAFVGSVAEALSTNVGQISVDVANAQRRASPLSVPTLLDRVPIPSVLHMLGNPQELNTLLASRGIPPVTSIMVGNSTLLEPNVPPPLNTTPAPPIFLEEEPTVATPMGLIIGISAGFASLFVCVAMIYIFLCSQKAAQKVVDEINERMKQNEEEEAERREAEKKEMIEQAVAAAKSEVAEKHKKGKLSGMLGYVKKKT